MVINIKKNPELKYSVDYVYIGRGSLYGNPFSFLPKDKCKALIQVKNREESLEKYNQWIHGNIIIEGIDPPSKEEILQLEGKILGCYCHPQPCHGHMLENFISEFKNSHRD